MNEKYNYCQVVGRTDVGQKRSANEDNMHTTVTRNGLVAVVCDGMGGHVGGATASSIAVTTIVEFLDRTFYDDPHIAISEAIDCANQAIIEKTQEQPSLTGMGSTCVVLLVRNGKVYLGHVGDSRIYLVRSRRIIQLTKDHSYVQTLVDSGEITKEQAEMHPRRNEITNALGIPNMAPATLSEAIIPEAGDCFVLCSDGLSGMVSDEAICKVVSRQTELPAQTRVNHLVDLANANGGLDNITVQIVEFAASPAAMVKRKGMPLFLKFGIASLVVAVLGVGAYFAYNHFTAEPKVDPPVGFVVMDGDREEFVYSSIPFEKGKEVVTLEFTDSTLMLKRGKDVIKTIEKCFDRSTFDLSDECSGKVKVVGDDNLTIKFTNTHPKTSVKFSVKYATESGDMKDYLFQFVVKSQTTSGVEDKPEGDIKGGGINISILPQNDVVNGEDADSDSDADGDEDVEDDSQNIIKDRVQEILYDSLKDQDRVTLYLSAKPNIKVKGNTYKLDFHNWAISPDEKIVCDDVWIIIKEEDKVVFKFKGEDTTDKNFEFVIPCVAGENKDRVNLVINLKPEPKDIFEKGEEESEKNEDNPESSDKKDESSIVDTGDKK